MNDDLSPNEMEADEVGNFELNEQGLDLGPARGRYLVCRQGSSCHNSVPSITHMLALWHLIFFMTLLFAILRTVESASR